MNFDAYFSDPHFGHVKIIEYEERPFSSVEEMNETMVANYNAVVGPNDFTLWGGDCFLGGVDGKKLLERLNGRKGLILGNHDKKAKAMAEMGFVFVVKELFMHVAGRLCRVNHYPYWTYGTQEDENGRLTFTDRHDREKTFTKEQVAKMKAVYPPRAKGEVLIHGHTHGKKRRHENMVHIGVDAWDYGPLRHEQLAELVAQV